jgi:hypothetical protein
MKTFNPKFAKALAADIAGDEAQDHLPRGIAASLLFTLGFASDPVTMVRVTTNIVRADGWACAVSNDADGLNKYVAAHAYVKCMQDHLDRQPDAPDQKADAPKTDTSFRDWIQDQEDKAMAAQAADGADDEAALLKRIAETIASITKVAGIGDDAPDVGQDLPDFLDMIRKLPGVRVINIKGDGK